MNEEKLSNLDSDEIEDIEKLTLRWVFQAVLDFGMEAHEIFLKSPDKVKDIAEDITRELLDRLPGFNVQQRIYGNVDYKRARYIILPEKTVRQALFIDSKAEKENRSATIQMSQTCMRVRQRRSGRAINEKGLLPEISEYGNNHYLTTTCLIHFLYEDAVGIHHLKERLVLISLWIFYAMTRSLSFMRGLPKQWLRNAPIRQAPSLLLTRVRSPQCLRARTREIPNCSVS